MEAQIIKILAPTTIAFIVGISFAPLVTRYLYKYKVWKKSGGKKALDGSDAREFNKLYKAGETKTPRMGGIVVWGSVLITLALLFVLRLIFPSSYFSELDFFSRSQTWIPLTTLIVGAAIGFINDFYDVTRVGQGISLKIRLILITVLSGGIGWWFYEKLDVISIGIPFDGFLQVGIFIIPIFILLTLGIYASGVIDGIDGLSGGVFVSIFAAYAGIAYLQAQFDVAAFSATIAGATLAFLWFNVPPARFWMTETGTMALTLTLAVIVFMTDSLGGGHGISLMLIVGLPLIATVLSNVLQVSSKKLRGKKLLKIAPLHHHFEAIGWPSYKVTMRYWIISVICALLGVTIASIA